MKSKFLLVTFLSLILFNGLKAQVDESKVLGEWTSPKKDSRVLIYKVKSSYYGKIVWGTGSSTKDEKNPNASLRNRELIGLVILNDFTYEDGVFTGGTIYDPREGKTYKCKMTLKSDNQLSIRGFIGISLFGRSEIWTKN
jgi:uncharacterized protein (DUF2147 family)